MVPVCDVEDEEIALSGIALDVAGTPLGAPLGPAVNRGTSAIIEPVRMIS